MTTAAARVTVAPRRAGFARDVLSLAGRALRSIPRDPESVIPALIIPLFFFVVTVGALQNLAGRLPGLDYKAFQLPVAIVFAVTGVSRANVLVIDIQSGYFDRLALTPVNRLAMLLGLMVADLALVIALAIPVVALGLIVGVRFETGILGMIVFILIGGLWGLAYTGFPYAIALKTGNPAAVNSSYLLFFPFSFLTTAFLPLDALTSWMATVARFNPTTYLLGGLRSIITDGWVFHEILYALLAVAGMGIVSITLALLALQGRVRRR